MVGTADQKTRQLWGYVTTQAQSTHVHTQNEHACKKVKDAVILIALMLCNARCQASCHLLVTSSYCNLNGINVITTIMLAQAERAKYVKGEMHL